MKLSHGAPLTRISTSTLWIAAGLTLGLGACKIDAPIDMDEGFADTGTGEEGGTGDTLGDDGAPPMDMANFVPDEDPEKACDPFLQDCPTGEKCVPYSTTGGNWNANKCVPVLGDGQPGDSCTWDGTSVATDSCGADSHCWDVMDLDGELVGVCTPFCQGSANSPICGPETSCLIANEGSINLCIQTCDPLLQDCGAGLGCFWSNNDFQCIFTAGEIPSGEPCGFINDCALANTCMVADVLPSCDGASCCTGFCDLTNPECQPDTECTPFFEEGFAPPGYEDVGICIIPGA